MPLINTSVPNLIQGVSQQPPAARFAGQCEEQENALSTVAEGLKKRPNTRHIAKLLDTAIDTNSFVHFIDRDDAEKYVIIHNGVGIEGWNILSGAKCSIKLNDAEGVTTPITPPNYLNTSTPNTSLKALTVADNTFIVNKDVSVSKSLTKTAPLDTKGFTYISQGDYEKRYQINVGGNINGVGADNQATFEIDVESYLWYRGWEKFRVSGVTITNAGSGYSATTPDILELTYNWGSLGSTVYSSYNTISTEPVIRVTFEDDGTGNGTKKVATATVENVGAFAQHNAEVTGGSFSGNYNASINATVGGDVATGQEYTFSTLGDNDTKAYMSDTAEIATSLFDDSVYPDEFESQPLITSDAAGNIFTVGSNFNSPPLTATREGSTIIIESNISGADFTLTTSDGLAGNGIKAVYKRINAISDLPVSAPNNFVIEIVGDADIDQDNYWVKFTTNTDTSFGEGAWTETVCPNISEGLDVDTMPMSIRSLDLNELELVTLDFAKRKAGDEDTNPDPSFVGLSINDVVFFKNRLGFVTDDSVVFSEAGEFFNFYRTTVSSLLDSAPIDITVSSTKVTKLKSAVIFQENLMLFADNVQYVVKGGDLFTPKTVSVSASTHFSLDDNTDPLLIGSYVYFPFTRGEFTGVRELTLSATTETYDAVEITEHVPAYIPSDIIAMAGTTSEDVLALVSGKVNSDGTHHRNELYIYKYFWNNNQKVLSSWSKFNFTGEIRQMTFIGSTLYMVMVNNNQTHIVQMPLESGLTDDTGFNTHLDMRVKVATSQNTINIFLPWKASATDKVEVWTEDGAYLESTPTSFGLTLKQKISEDTNVWVGIPYNMKYTFSEQIFKAPAGKGTSPSDFTKLMLRNLALFYNDTAAFKVKVTPNFRPEVTSEFSSTVIGASTIGSLPLDSGSFRTSLFTKAEDTSISIESDSALPCSFQSAEFEAFTHPRSNRYNS